ncbi:MAG TPA: cyclase family protein [Thermomicrobiales bacterium]|jgi:kynurenine formamidase|nr:cyclase family protein [Thermomicrobiales bacterium]
MCHPDLLHDVHRRIGGTRRLDRRRASGLMLGATMAGPGLAHAARPAVDVATQTGDDRREVSFNAVIDLTHPLSPDFPVYPGYTPFSASVTATLDDPGTRSRVVSFEEHTGTHVDAPAHFIADGVDVASIPPTNLVASLVVIDLRDRASADEDTTVQVDDLLAWEAAYGAIREGAFVAMYSGWDERVPSAAGYLNADAAGVLHFPAWSPEAAAYLVDERGVVGLGVDTISLDNPTSPYFESHRVLLGAGGYAVENLANLGAAPASGATVVVGAPAFAGGSGGAARVLALART